MAEKLMADGWYQLDTGWGCGGIRIEDDKVAEAAPIFKKFKGMMAYKLAVAYTITLLPRKP